MLTKRTNILIQEETWQRLVDLARQMNTSAGELIRRAIKKTYFADDRNDEIARAVQSIRAIRPKIKGKINYKELINEGRKY